MFDDNTKRLPTESEIKTVQVDSHKFEGGPEFESEALSTYTDALKGLQVSDTDSERLLATFRNIIREVTDSKESYEPFIRGIAEMQKVAQEAVVADRLTEMRAVLAVEVPWAILCQKSGCDWCRTGGYGRLDDLLIGCIPGWKCYYIKVPEGFCEWTGS